MTSDGEALLWAVGENLWEDAPRLIYADWLDENGHPDRAAFIRNEVAIEAQVKRRQRLSDAQIACRQQLQFVRAAWLAELPKFPGVEWDDTFDCGFPARVNTSSATAFLNHAEDIYRHAPVCWVKIRGVSKRTAEELPRSPYLARLQGLDLRTCYLGDDGVRELCTSPHLSRLWVLNLSHVGLRDDGLRAVAACRGLGGLSGLWLDGNAVTDAGAAALAESPHLPNLTNVWHAGTQITETGKQALQWMAERNKARLPEWTDAPDG